MNVDQIGGYTKKRWLMLAIFMLVTIMVEVQWLTHAPIARVAQAFYKEQLAEYSWLTVDSLAVVYMLVYIVMCLPASYVIDTYGIRKGIGLGALFVILGSLVKGIYGSDLLLVFFGQLLLAMAQPFIINAVTAFSKRWFPENERAMAAGFAALAQYLGIVLVMLVTPVLVVSSSNSANYGNGVDIMLFVYMVPSVLSGVLILFFLKETPENSSFDSAAETLSFGKGLLHLFRLKNAVLTIILFTMGLGIFNAISSLVDAIAANLGIKDSDGLIGGTMLIGGIIGAIILPILSDKYQKRKIFLVACIAGTVPAIATLAYATEISNVLMMSADQTYGLALAASFLLGFCIMSAGPIGFQYMAEVTTPTPEATSQGILLLVGQVSGIVLVMLMGIQDNMYLGGIMKLFVPLTILSFVLVLFLKDSKFIKA